MINFFSHNIEIPFVPFDWIHWLVLITTFGLSIVIYIFRDKLEKYKINKRILKYFAIFLLVDQIIFYVAFTYYGTLSLETDLPWHYCYVTGFLYTYMLWFDKKKMFNWLFYSAFMCTTASIIWMDIEFSYDRYMFYRFLIGHSGLFMINIYLFYVLNFPADKKGMIIAFIYSNVLFLIMSIYNAIFGTNYIMSKEFPPLIYRLYPWIEKIDYPIIWMEIMGIIVMILAYQLVRLKKAK